MKISSLTLWALALTLTPGGTRAATYQQVGGIVVSGTTARESDMV